MQNNDPGLVSAAVAPALDLEDPFGYSPEEDAIVASDLMHDYF